MLKNKINKMVESIKEVPDTHKSNLLETIISVMTCLLGLSVVLYANRKEN